MFKNFTDVYIKEIKHYHPEGKLTNDLFEQRLDTTADWISNRVGINERRYLDDYRGNTPVFEMCKRVLEKREFELDSVDCLIASSSFADKFYPTTAQTICQEYSLNIPNYQLLGGCTSLVQSLLMAATLIESGCHQNVLILNGEPMSRQVDYGDRTSCILFGDASSMILLSKNKSDAQIKSISYSGIGIDLVGNYNFSKSTQTTVYEFVSGIEERRKNILNYNNAMSAVGKFYQDGKQIKEFVYDKVPAAIDDFLNKTKLTKNQIDNYIFHQANLSIMTELIKRLEFDPNKHRYNIHKYGNTASAGWMTVLSEIFNSHDYHRQNVIISSFGAGMTYGNILLEL